MVRIRLARAGAKKTPFYRIVVTDHHSPRGGKFLESIGTFDPRRSPIAVTIKQDRLDYWKSKGAQLSETVTSVLKKGIQQPVAAVAG